jgi:hypothetical protein
MEALLSFLRELERLGVGYDIFYGSADAFGEGYRRMTINVYASAAEHWEVEFWDDGTVDVERFVSSGPVDDADLAALVDELRADRDAPETPEA